ncbi:oligosaccharide flippase family protein [Limisphaera sp. 4302-co]|uniref:oligosaccharide flippase family protein n=1 Tax=Limisphaera sp. 4302-co TaxID=3400417 RepID=UPI003C29C07E
MALRKQVLTGTGWVALGEGIGYVASFARNMILARLLSKADFGMAAVFAMVMSLLEFTAKLSVGRFLIRDPEGDDPVFVNTGHTLQALAAGVSAVLIVLASPVLAAWFGVADHSWAIMVLGGVVLVRGLQHLDTQRFQRHLRFGPAAAVEAIPQVIVTLAAWPVARWLGDYRAVLVLLAAKGLLSLLLSHVLAERRYRWGWHPEYGRRMLQFGWPLLLTGFLMFGIMQGDQFLVASFYDLAELAPYAAAVSLVMAPQMLYGRIFNSVALPLVSRVQDDLPAFRRRYRQVLGIMILYASVSTAGFIVGAEALMRVVYGSKYAGAGPLMAWVSVVAAYRCLRMAVAVANIAKGDSQSQLIANGWRAISLVPAFFVAWSGQPLWMIAACGLIGEILATLVCVWRLERRDATPMGLTLRPAAGISLLSCAAGVVAHWTLQAPVWAGLLAAVICACLAGAAAVALTPELRSEVIVLWQGFRQQGPAGAVRQWLGVSLQATPQACQSDR